MSEIPVNVARIMTACRFILVTLLAFLLLGPMVRTITREVEKPIVILALDDSRSIVNSKDSTTQIEALKKSYAVLNDGLKGDYELRTFSFGDHVREKADFNFNDKETNLGDLYDELDVQFANRNVGAIVIASDGLYNEGANPAYGPTRLKVPVYTLALGDTTIKKDLILSKVNNNRVAFLGNSYPLEVVIDARQCAGNNATLIIEEDSLRVFSRSIEVSGNNYHTTIPVTLDAKKKGIRHIRISISSLPDEVTYSNNVRDVFVEVIENKQKILILSNAPNPDESALRAVIENSPNYELKIDQLSTFDGRVGEYSLIILHNLPSGTQSVNNLLEKINAAGTSVWYILGASANITAFNALNTGLEITDQKGRLNEAQALYASEFSLFTISNELQEQIVSWPPLYAPFGFYKSTGNIYPLFYQRLGSVNTKQPLLFFSEKDGRKIAVTTGEGIWKWRLADYNANANHTFSDELFSRIIQYLSVKENRSPFRIFTKNNFRENEPLVFDAELYNQSDQLINEPEVRMTLVNYKGEQFPYTFSRTEKAYTLNAGLYPVGNYKYKAETKLGDRIYSETGEFSVSALQLETSNTVADHQLLSAIASKTGGKMFAPEQVNELLKALKEREDLKSISFSRKKLDDMVSLPWVFILLISLLSLEWFLRKRSGAY